NALRCGLVAAVTTDAAPAAVRQAPASVPSVAAVAVRRRGRERRDLHGCDPRRRRDRVPAPVAAGAGGPRHRPDVLAGAVAPPLPRAGPPGASAAGGAGTAGVVAARATGVVGMGARAWWTCRTRGAGCDGWWLSNARGTTTAPEPIAAAPTPSAATFAAAGA